MLTAVVLEFYGQLQSEYPNRLQPGWNCNGAERYRCTVARDSSKMFWINMCFAFFTLVVRFLYVSTGFMWFVFKKTRHRKWERNKLQTLDLLNTLKLTFSHNNLLPIYIVFLLHYARSSVSLVNCVCVWLLSPQWRCGPTRAMASSFLRFLDHTQRRITLGSTPLDAWSVCHSDLYLTTHNTHNRQTSMPPVGFEPTISAGERP